MEVCIKVQGNRMQGLETSTSQRDWLGASIQGTQKERQRLAVMQRAQRLPNNDAAALGKTLTRPLVPRVLGL